MQELLCDVVVKVSLLGRDGSPTAHGRRLLDCYICIIYMTDIHDNIVWSIIDTYFKDNPDILVKHHIDSYNDFYNKGLPSILMERNPIKILNAFDGNKAEILL